MKRRLTLAPFLLPIAFALTGCSDEGPLEETGEAVDEAVEDAGDALEDAVDAVEDGGI